MEILRVRAVWSGIPGMPGVSTFYRAGGADINNSSLLTFFQTISSLLPNALSINVPNSGDTLESTTGALTGTWSGTGGGTVTSTVSPAAYAAGVGARVRWNTGVIVGRRRLVGSTFIAPLVGLNYESNGTIATPALNGIQGAATALATAGVAWQIWARPLPARTSPSGTLPARVGATGPILSAIVPDMVTSLRSRRT